MVGFKRFFGNEEGMVAIIFAIIAIPFIALGGWGVDYLRLYHVRDFLQGQADAAALSATMETNDWPALSAQLEAVVRAQTVLQYGTAGWAENVQVVAEHVPGTTSDFRVTASANVPLAFMSLVPGIPDAQPVAVAAVARLTEIAYDYEPPALAELDPEAGDYNRIWLYCFWPDRPEGNPAMPRRTQMVPIADNGGSVYVMDSLDRIDDVMLDNEERDAMAASSLGLDGREKGLWRISAFSGAQTTSPVYTDTRSARTYVYRLPACESGSYQSMRLENVRFSRTNAQYWDANAPLNSGGDRHNGRFNYYTDAVITAGTESYTGLQLHHSNTSHVDHMRPVNLLETVLCNTMSECVNRPSGVIPTGRNRNPQRETRACEPGKYMYYGWEDRPPGLTGSSRDWQDYAWTDRDFDDIRVIIPCPVERPADERLVRLIQ